MYENPIAYTFHAYGRSEGLAGIIISDHEYPALVAHQLLSKLVDEFLSKHPRSIFTSAPAGGVPFPPLKEYIVKYQDPAQADSIMKIQKELDETKITLHKTIESVLERNVKLDDLVNKSEGLSSQSKMFYTQVSLLSAVEGFTRMVTDRAGIIIGEEAELMLHGHVMLRYYNYVPLMTRSHDHGCSKANAAHIPPRFGLHPSSSLKQNRSSNKTTSCATC